MSPRCPTARSPARGGGTGNFSLVVRGKSAHAGRNPDEGRNALVAALRSRGAPRLRQSAPCLAVNPARIDGGGPNNVVPDLAILRVNFRPRDVTARSPAPRPRSTTRRSSVMRGV